MKLPERVNFKQQAMHMKSVGIPQGDCSFDPYIDIGHNDQESEKFAQL